MNQTSKIASIAIITAVIMMATTQTASAQPTATNIKYKGVSADAYWYSENNGIYTDVYLFASQYSTHEKSEKYTNSGAYIGVYQYTLGNEICEEWDGYTYCWNEYIPLKTFFGYSEFTPANFETNGRLVSASLDSTINGYDYLSETEKTVTVRINWTGEGEYSTGNSHYNYHSQSYSYRGQYIGTDRMATATGSISGDLTMDLGSSTYGYLHNSRSGTAYVTNY